MENEKRSLDPHITMGKKEAEETYHKTIASSHHNPKIMKARL